MSARDVKGALEAAALSVGYDGKGRAGTAAGPGKGGVVGGGRIVAREDSGRIAACDDRSRIVAAERIIAADISFSINPGDFTVLIGPNGSGKSTLLKTLCGALKPRAGQVRFDGVPIAGLSARERARGIGVVLTDRVSVGFLTARDLVGLGRYPYTSWSGSFDAADRTAVEWALEMTGSADLADRPVSRLSDGERQKVMIARALAQEPAVLLLDEPTAFLDIRRKAEIMALLRGLAHDHGRGVLLSTHDLDLAMRLADRIILIDSDGNVLSGAPEDLVLSGDMERVFSSPGAAFDPGTGGFSFPRQVRGTAVVRGRGAEGSGKIAGGDGPAGNDRPAGRDRLSGSVEAAVYWVSRALERVGYRVVRREGGGSAEGKIGQTVGESEKNTDFPADVPLRIFISVEDSDGRTVFRLHCSEKEKAVSEFFTVLDLLNAVK